MKKVTATYYHSVSIDRTFKKLNKAGLNPHGKITYPNFSIKVEVPVEEKSEKQTAEKILKQTGGDKVKVKY